MTNSDSPNNNPNNSQTSEIYTSPFDALRRLDQKDEEYWSARELAQILGYTNWRNFKYAIEKAKIACQKSGYQLADHFDATIKMVILGSGAKRKVEDINMSRYACYLLVQNADPAKQIVAQAQTYFAQKTRQAELAEAGQLSALPEDRRRLILRSEMQQQDSRLAQVARQAGVETAADLEEFQEHGYRGLYGGLSRPEIKTRKVIPAEDDLLDYLGSEELATNFFRATQTAARLRSEEVSDKAEANTTHQQVGRKVRELISELGNTMPEDLPAAEESIQQLEQKERQRLRAISSPLLKSNKVVRKPKPPTDNL